MHRELREIFSADLDSLVSEIIDDYGLKYGKEEASLSSPIVRWLDFTLRYIQPNRRSIFYSNRFPLNLGPDVNASLGYIINLMSSGSDLNPYQSKGLTIYNDTSGTRREARTDLLFADWGIHHLHLTAVPIAAGRYFADRSEWLLFCIFLHDEVGLIDVRRHDEPALFSDPGLFSTVVQSWPNLVEHLRVKGMTSITNLPKTSREIAQLRKSGVTSFVDVDGAVYLGPGMGVTTASTSTRVAMTTIRINRYVDMLANLCVNPGFRPVMDAAASGIAEPDFHIALTPDGLCIHERVSNRPYVLPRARVVGGRDGLAEFHDLVLPEWSLPFLLSKSSA